MKTLRFIVLYAIILTACSGSDTPGTEVDNWTENQEIHFYNDCKEKMLGHGESEDNAHVFCECCLLKLKDQFNDGKEAMQKLTDDEIRTIEQDCMKK